MESRASLTVGDREFFLEVRDAFDSEAIHGPLVIHELLADGTGRVIAATTGDLCIGQNEGLPRYLAASLWTDDLPSWGSYVEFFDSANPSHRVGTHIRNSAWLVALSDGFSDDTEVSMHVTDGPGGNRVAISMDATPLSILINRPEDLEPNPVSWGR